MEFSKKAFKQYSGMVKRKMAERFLCKMEASIHESALPARASEQAEQRVYPAVKLSTVETPDGVLIPYNPYVSLQRQAKFLASQEKFYWRYHRVLAALIILLFAAISFATAVTAQRTPQWAVPFAQWLTDYLSLTIFRSDGIIGTGINSFGHFLTNPIFACVSFASIGIMAATAAKLSIQPTALLIGPKGLKLRWQWGRMAVNGTLMPWSDFSALKLEKPGKTTVAENWLVTFESEKLRPLRLKLAGLPGQLDRERMLEAVDRYATALSVDPEILQAFEPPQKRSYTELWLESLAAPPKRERLNPVAAGTALYGGRYTVIRQLGVGGQGTAYSAAVAGKRGDNEDEVVLKEFILPVYVERTVRKQALDRFENEASILQKLDHPKIVKLVDYFIEDHRVYLVLEYIKGTSLREYVAREGALPAVEVFALVESMLEILNYLHTLSPPVVHRDFTPDNLITDRSEGVKLIDFNVAQQSDSTATGTVVGKHSYLPPEQFRGKPTPKSDIYAFGATIYYLLTGKDPEPLTCSHPIIANDKTPLVLDEIVARCTALDQSDRFDSVDEIYSTLKAAREKRAQE